MKLSELKTGEKGVIVRVSGHGGFRKRIIEMGFIKGKEVDVLLNAPLKDPVKYKVMGARGDGEAAPHQRGSGRQSQLRQDLALQFRLRRP